MRGLLCGGQLAKPQPPSTSLGGYTCRTALPSSHDSSSRRQPSLPARLPAFPQEIAGHEEMVGQYESMKSFTMPGLYRVVEVRAFPGRAGRRAGTCAEAGSRMGPACGGPWVGADGACLRVLSGWVGRGGLAST